MITTKQFFEVVANYNCEDFPTQILKSAGMSQAALKTALFGENGTMYVNMLCKSVPVFYIYPDTQSDLYSEFITRCGSCVDIVGMDCAGQCLCAIGIDITK